MKKMAGYQIGILLGSMVVALPAYGFNAILLYDPDFLEFALIAVPICASFLMGIGEGFATMKWLKPKETPAFFYIATYIYACFMAMLLSILVIGVLFFAVGEILNDTDSPAFLWGAMGYFALMFGYLGWYQRHRDVVKMWGKEEAKYIPIKPIVAISTCVSYSLLYVFYYNQLF